jgi:GNAT superfamily N-acetyltransferase
MVDGQIKIDSIGGKVVTDIRIREARPSDSPDLARLVTQLGYPTDAGEMAERMEALASRPEYALFVAEASGRAIGLVGAFLGYALEFSGSWGRLMGLVVDEPFRGRGIGARLMERMEGWLREHGASRLTLTSGSQRADAHRFYRRLGYEQTGFRFTKRL